MHRGAADFLCQLQCLNGPRSDAAVSDTHDRKEPAQADSDTQQRTRKQAKVKCMLSTDSWDGSCRKLTSSCCAASCRICTQHSLRALTHSVYMSGTLPHGEAHWNLI